MTLSALLAESQVQVVGKVGEAEILSITQDSRQVTPGALFVCNPGTTTDSHEYIPDAAAKGAVVAAVWSSAGFDTAQRAGMAAIQLAEDRIPFNDAVCRLCNTFFGYPTRSMKVVGVTGTNGKTTTAWLIRDMLAALGLKAGYLGTLGFQIPGEERELGNTTPYPVELWSLLAEARDKGVEAMAMEVSSHALAEHRSEFVEFDAGVFTNLTQDHLDFHGSMEEYEAAKLRLFTELPKQTVKDFTGAVNGDDPAGLNFINEAFTPPVIFHLLPLLPDHSQESPLNFNPVSARFRRLLFGVAPEVEVDHIVLQLMVPMSPMMPGIRVSLGGSYNVENCMSAAAGLLALGFSLADVASALPGARPVPGRFEAVPNDLGIGVLVDYAHTPDAVEKLLDAVRPLTKGRVITVFGCGGDRDRTKRPRMAKAASERSDITVITSDNPRTEDAVQILKDVAAGIEGLVDWSRVPGHDLEGHGTHGQDAHATAGHDLAGHGTPAQDALAAAGHDLAGRETHGQAAHATTEQSARATVIVDRREAITHAVKIAEPGDVVVIAGKGHENYQIIGRTKYPMDDRLMAKEALEAR